MHFQTFLYTLKSNICSKILTLGRTNLYIIVLIQVVYQCIFHVNWLRGIKTKKHFIHQKYLITLSGLSIVNFINIFIERCTQFPVSTRKISVLQPEKGTMSLTLTAEMITRNPVISDSTTPIYNLVYQADDKYKAHSFSQK